MDFIITKEQQRMRKAAREFLKSKCTTDFVRAMEKDETGFTDDFWESMVALDWMALPVPESYGGVGGELLDLVFLLEEFGRVCTPGPYFSTVVLGGLTISEFGSEDQKNWLLPLIVSGERKLTLALTEHGSSRWDPNLISLRAEKNGDEYVLNGRKLFVPDAHVADSIIVAARTSGADDCPEGITLFLLDTKAINLRPIPLKTIAGDKQFELVFTDIAVSSSAIIHKPDEGSNCLTRILNLAAVCKCAEMVGAISRVVEMASNYARERCQFGKPIGSFQAIQHHCANMLIELEGSRYITYKAAWMLGNGLFCDKIVSTAKAWVSDACKKVMALGHQVQGGAAFMEEHDMQLFSRRAASWSVNFGDSDFHRKKVACSINL